MCYNKGTMGEEIRTHRSIDQSLSGKPKEVRDRYALVVLTTDDRMGADDKGLVHGGFIFSAADYAAMLSVNSPTVVLAGANVKFLKPVVVGDTVEFEAKVVKEDGKKKIVMVIGRKDGYKVFEGEFICVVLGKHVLDRS